MDVAYIHALRKKADEEKPEETGYPGETVSDRPLTPALFDAVFANDNVGSD